MSLTPTQTNILIASLSAFIILAILITLILLRGRVPFTFSRSNPPSTLPIHTPAKKPRYRTWFRSTSHTSSNFRSGEKNIVSTEGREGREGSAGENSEEVEGMYEKYGKLYIPPNKQPTIIALDIIMRCLLATGLPGRATSAPAKKPETAVVRDGGFEGASMMENGHVVGSPRVSLGLEWPVSFSVGEGVEIMLSPTRPAKVEQKGELADSVLDQSQEKDVVDAVKRG